MEDIVDILSVKLNRGGSPLKPGHKYHGRSKRWSEEETERFIEAVRTYGKDWEKVINQVGTRSLPSVHYFAQLFVTESF